MAQVARKMAEHVLNGMRQRIEDGTWRPDQMLPGRRALAAEYGVALATLERAVAVLMSEGLLRADKRRGTFVATPAPTSKDPVIPANARTPHAPLIATVAVVASVVQGLSDDETQWPLNILRACEDQLGTVSGITVRFVNAKAPDGNRRSPSDLFEEVRQVAPDGIVAIDCFPLQELLSSLPAVSAVHVLFEPDDAASRQVTMDDPYGGMQAARHLLDQGYWRLLYFQPFVAGWAARRLAGVRTAVAGSPAVVLDVWPRVQASLLERGYSLRQQALAHEAAQALMRDGLVAGVGVIAANDAAAMGFMQAATEQGLKAGVDYGIIGFDDYERRADLSTMRPPLEQMGAEAARLMERVLRGQAGPSRVMVHHRLISRGSSRRREAGPGGATSNDFGGTVCS
jgi:DNA-binding LacI/PurR family transcriptional regulator